MTRQIRRTLAAAEKHFVGGRIGKAEALFEEVLAADGGSGEALEGLAYVAAKRGDYARAADYMARALTRLVPSPARFHTAAGIYQRAQRHDQAAELFARCLDWAPDHAPSYLGLARSLAVLGENERALATLDRLATIHPELALAPYNKGWLLGSMGRYEEEMAAYRSAIALKPDYTDAYVNLGVALRDLHRFDEAMRMFDSAIEIDPGHAGAHNNRAQTNLLLGNFEPGWREYEWRWLDGSMAHGFDGARLWNGDQSIAGKTVLAHFEQGIGDTLQFARYVDLLQRAGARVILRVQDSLVELLTGSMESVQIVGEHDPVPEFDLHCPLLSLPLAFRTQADDIPAPIPYLRADAGRMAQWAALLAGVSSTPCVGIAWAGSRVHHDDRNRSLRLAELGPLLAANARFVSLQKEVRDEDRATFRAFGGLVDVSEQLDSYADTAALISQLDLVISVDTSVAHLAGALGTPAWIALPFTPDWRWQMGRTDSPWYPQARLFRQAARGDWAGVAAELRTALGARSIGDR